MCFCFKSFPNYEIVQVVLSKHSPYHADDDLTFFQNLICCLNFGTLWGLQVLVPLRMVHLQFKSSGVLCIEVKHIYQEHKD